MTHETTVSNLLIVAIICFAAGATGSLLTASKPTVARFTAHILAIAGSVAVLGLGVIGVGGGTLNKGVQLFTPLGGLRFGLDRLSAFFLLIIAIGAIPASLYGIGYTREYDGKRSLAALGFAFNLFLAAMTLVALASNVLTFLLFWELMSLASYLLVMTESDREGTEHAGWIYLVMTHGGFACLLLGFLLCSNATGTMNFTGWTAQVTHLSGATRNACFVLLAAGFGSKAGLVPLHAWLPRAHPAAPSHVSALMSGVMIKLGIYGLIRIGFDWLGTGPAWWGGSLLVAAAISAMVGVLYALVESDLKRLLAYSSVENIGIITLGIGSGLLFHTYHREPLAALALVAALFHTLNHALFKGLLFSGAGSILQAVHTRNLEKMGGLIKRMPHTAVLFLIGTVAIAALPPLNGFFSEWLTFQSLLLSFEIPVRAVSLVFALSVGALALTSGLAAACFVKAFGIGFLALPRSEQAARATEAPVTMRAAMALLAVACIALGIAPVLALRIITPTAAELIGSSPDLHYNWHTVVANNAFASVSPLWLG
ncbi:MAG TPA: proton-conducting transporter membrane subunit, partial [Blastocatellia bacterium]|nr:proton-conducting transporter membrane subunit [Blastocatellia bacterium]